MAKEILLFGGIYSYSAESVVNAIEAHKNNPISMRVNSGGGVVEYAKSIWNKVKEHGNVTGIVDGIAASAAGQLLFFFKKVKAYSDSNIMFHRAYGYADSETGKAYLAKINSDIKAALLKRVNADKFKSVTGVSIEDMFNEELPRKDVFLTATQAKELGIVDEIISSDPQEARAEYGFINEWNMKVAAEATPPSPTNPPTNPTVMTYEEFKAKHPELFNKIVAEGKVTGVNAERERVKAWGAYIKVDPDMVKKSIEDGTEMSMAVMADMSVKMSAPDYLEKLKAESKAITPVAGAIGTQTDKEKEEEAYRAKAKAERDLAAGKTAAK